LGSNRVNPTRPAKNPNLASRALRIETYNNIFACSFAINCITFSHYLGGCSVGSHEGSHGGNHGGTSLYQHPPRKEDRSACGAKYTHSLQNINPHAIQVKPRRICGQDIHQMSRRACENIHQLTSACPKDLLPLKAQRATRAVQTTVDREV